MPLEVFSFISEGVNKPHPSSALLCSLSVQQWVEDDSKFIILGSLLSNSTLSAGHTQAQARPLAWVFINNPLPGTPAWLLPGHPSAELPHTPSACHFILPLALNLPCDCSFRYGIQGQVHWLINEYIMEAKLYKKKIPKVAILEI